MEIIHTHSIISGIEWVLVARTQRFTIIIATVGEELVSVLAG